MAYLPHSMKLTKSSISSHLCVRFRISGSCSAIQSSRSAVEKRHNVLPPIEKVFSAPTLSTHHSNCGWVRGQCQLIIG